MIIDIDLRRMDARFQLLDAEEFHALKLVIHTAKLNADTAEALTHLGEWNGSHIFIKPEKLCELAGDHVLNATWTKEFNGMVAYAIASGWANGDGALRLHVEYTLD